MPKQYRYGGKVYNLPDGTSDADALAFVEAQHEGEESGQRVSNMPDMDISPSLMDKVGQGIKWMFQPKMSADQLGAERQAHPDVSRAPIGAEVSKPQGFMSERDMDEAASSMTSPVNVGLAVSGDPFVAGTSKVATVASRIASGAAGVSGVLQGERQAEEGHPVAGMLNAGVGMLGAYGAGKGIAPETGENLMNRVVGTDVNALDAGINPGAALVRRGLNANSAESLLEKIHEARISDPDSPSLIEAEQSLSHKINASKLRPAMGMSDWATGGAVLGAAELAGGAQTAIHHPVATAATVGTGIAAKKLLGSTPVASRMATWLGRQSLPPDLSYEMPEFVEGEYLPPNPEPPKQLGIPSAQGVPTSLYKDVPSQFSQPESSVLPLDRLPHGESERGLPVKSNGPFQMGHPEMAPDLRGPQFDQTPMPAPGGTLRRKLQQPDPKASLLDRVNGPVVQSKGAQGAEATQQAFAEQGLNITLEQAENDVMNQAAQARAALDHVAKTNPELAKALESHPDFAPLFETANEIATRRGTTINDVARGNGKANQGIAAGSAPEAGEGNGGLQSIPPEARGTLAEKVNGKVGEGATPPVESTENTRADRFDTHSLQDQMRANLEAHGEVADSTRNKLFYAGNKPDYDPMIGEWEGGAPTLFDFLDQLKQRRQAIESEGPPRLGSGPGAMLKKNSTLSARVAAGPETGPPESINELASLGKGKRWEDFPPKPEDWGNKPSKRMLGPSGFIGPDGKIYGGGYDTAVHNMILEQKTGIKMSDEAALEDFKRRNNIIRFSSGDYFEYPFAELNARPTDAQINTLRKLHNFASDPMNGWDEHGMELQLPGTSRLNEWITKPEGSEGISMDGKFPVINGKPVAMYSKEHLDWLHNRKVFKPRTPGEMRMMIDEAFPDEQK